jgi:hypothetical protein
VRESAFVFFWLRALHDAKTPRDGYHVYHPYRRSPNHVRLGGGPYNRKMNSSSWQTTRPMMATMVTMGTNSLQTVEIHWYPLKLHGYQGRFDRMWIC